MPKVDRAALSIQEFSEYLGVSELLTRKLIAQGQVRSVKLGRRVVIPRSELERLLEAKAA